MKKSSLIILLILLTIAHAYSLSESEIAQKAFSSVVVVIIADENGEIISAGSGFFVKENIVVTNLHIIASGVVGFVKIVAREEKYIIEGLVGVDKTRDIILLKIKDIKTSFLELGDSDKMKINDEIYVVGNPQGLEGTFSSGIINNIHEIGQDKYFQISTPISEGSNGGPVLNSMGEIIGVAFATVEEGQNLNLAIPSKYIKQLISNLQPLESLSKFQESKSDSILYKDVIYEILLLEEIDDQLVTLSQELVETCQYLDGEDYYNVMQLSVSIHAANIIIRWSSDLLYVFNYLENEKNKKELAEFIEKRCKHSSSLLELEIKRINRYLTNTNNTYAISLGKDGKKEIEDAIEILDSIKLKE